MRKEYILIVSTSLCGRASSFPSLTRSFYPASGDSTRNMVNRGLAAFYWLHTYAGI